MKMSSLDDVLLMAVWMIIAGWTHCTHGGHSWPHLQGIFDSDHLAEVGNCLTAKNACLARRTCRDALVRTMTQCQGVVTNPPEDTGPVGNVVQSFGPPSFPSESETSSCPTACQQALASLLSSESGQELAKCRCGPRQTLCHDIRRRLNASCHDPLHFLLNPSADQPSSFPPLSCRMAEAMCNGDTACSLALEYHHVLCRKMFQGQFCSSKCRNSLEVLLNQTYGQALRHCHCAITPADAAYHCRQRYQSHRELCTAGYTLQHPAKGYAYDSGDSLTKNHHYSKGEAKGDHQAQEEIMRLVRLEDADGLQHREPLEEEDHALMSGGMDEEDAENIRPLDNGPQRSHLAHNSWPWLTLPLPAAGHSAASRFQPVITYAWPLFLTLSFLHLCLRWQL